ncbi:MAG: hypothetical protein KKG04_08170 [Candidatus Thermoplasmatota archaeon]|nr:hypothetical protein [Candidatus Thermoplasmatota archaeon]
MVRYKPGDYIVAKMDILYDPVFAGVNDVKEGCVGKVEEVLMNVQIQGVNLFCDDKDYTTHDLGTGFSTFLAVQWLTGPQKGKCLKTHQSNVKRITEEEAQFLIKKDIR